MVGGEWASGRMGCLVTTLTSINKYFYEWQDTTWTRISNGPEGAWNGIYSSFLHMEICLSLFADMTIQFVFALCVTQFIIQFCILNWMSKQATKHWRTQPTVIRIHFLVKRLASAMWFLVSRIWINFILIPIKNHSLSAHHSLTCLAECFQLFGH